MQNLQKRYLTSSPLIEETFPVPWCFFLINGPDLFTRMYIIKEAPEDKPSGFKMHRALINSDFSG